ncbi:MAG: endonuclease/exonuclease/phosphatase family protein [Rubripirellula sp.]
MNHEPTKSETSKQRWPRAKRVLYAVVFLVSVSLVPYFYSRVCAPGNRIQTFNFGGGDTVVDSRESFDGQIRVVTFNIAHGRGATDDNWEEPGSAKFARIKKIATLIGDLDADVVILNEVDFDATWSGRQNQAEAIAQQAGFPFRVEERNLDFALIYGSWRFGNAILSKYPITNSTLLNLPDYAGWESWLAGCKRGVMCDVKPPGSSPIRVMGVHLSHRSESLRTKSARMILDLASQNAVPTIIAGDFNSTPRGFPGSDQTTVNAMDTFALSGLFRLWPNTPVTRDTMTYSSTEPRSVIDWILVTPECSVGSCRVIQSDLSDHRPVVCDIVVDFD